MDINVIRADLKTVAAARVLLAHQSVGGNIVQGVKDLAAQADVPLHIELINGTAIGQGPGLYHLYIGMNGDPAGKVKAFVQLLTAPQHPDFDLAALKFCYVDFDTAVADRLRILDLYAAGVNQLHTARPEQRLLHVTVPLMYGPPGWKSAVKRLLGRETEWDEGNALRDSYNEQLLSRFHGEPLFDLAAVESTGADGKRTTTTYQGRQIDALTPAYTFDGGHLNEQGRRVAAAAFLHAAARALAGPKSAP